MTPSNSNTVERQPVSKTHVNAPSPGTEPATDETREAWEPEQLQRSLQFAGGMGAEGGDVDKSVESSIRQARGSGQPLGKDIRGRMEHAFKADFGGVRIHQNTKADHLNRQLNAKAFTTGQNIFFKQGNYNPGNSGGQKLLAHELTHVVQQSNGQVQRAFGARQAMVQRALQFGPDWPSGILGDLEGGAAEKERIRRAFEWLKTSAKFAV